MTLPLSVHAKKAAEPVYKQMPASMRHHEPAAVLSTTPAKPKGDGIRVQAGDSVYLLAKRYGVSARAIIEANRLKPPYSLKKGQKLTMPVSRTYKVKRGDSLYDISREYGVDMRSIVKENKLKKPYMVRVGQKLKIPLRSYSKSQDRQEIEMTRGSSKERKTTPRVFIGKAEFAPKISRGQFNWPARGKVLSRFGTKQGGVSNDGINIAANEGAKVYAAADGEVVYAGNELKGYGNLLLLRHDDGWMSAYGHTKEFVVEKGMRVKKGQLIGYVGSSGNVEKPQLHFALRKGRKAVDPLKYL